MKRKDKVVLPFGKFKGRTLVDVMREEPGYLCWFYDTIEDQRELKAAMEALPGFPARLAAYRERRSVKEKSLEQRIEDVVTRMFRVEPTQGEIDTLCDESVRPGGRVGGEDEMALRHLRPPPPTVSEQAHGTDAE